MKLIALVMFCCLIVFSYFGETEASLWVNYEDFAYKSDIATISIEPTFVLSNRQVDQLAEWKETDLSLLGENKISLKKPIISVMVVPSDNEKKDEVSLEAKSNITNVLNRGHIQIQPEKEHVVYFGFDSYVLGKKQIFKLQGINLKGGEKVDIYGYACPIGSESYNKKLSQKRAQVVADYLQKRGVEVGKVVGMGETNEDKDLSLNRKAIIKFY